MEKLCIFCKHLKLYTGSPGYSEYTPGESFSMSCAKGVHMENDYLDESEFRAEIMKANECNYYESVSS